MDPRKRWMKADLGCRIWNVGNYSWMGGRMHRSYAGCTGIVRWALKPSRVHAECTRVIMISQNESRLWSFGALRKIYKWTRDETDLTLKMDSHRRWINLYPFPMMTSSVLGWSDGRTLCLDQMQNFIVIRDDKLFWVHAECARVIMITWRDTLHRPFLFYFSDTDPFSS